MISQPIVRVMITEDDYLVSEMIKSMLEDAGYAVVGQARNGHEALSLAQTLRPDVILMDIRMPDMDGVETARRINQACPTPMVILTAYESPDLLRRSSEAGVGAYLVKPPNAGEMERAITVARARFADLMELRKINAELEARNRELDAFAHTVAHDIQNTLSLIRGFSEALYTYHATMEKTELEDCALAIVKHVQKISNVTAELLLLSEVRKADVKLTTLDMAPIVESALQRLSSLIEEHRANVVLPDAAWPACRGHAVWVEEIWVNYISNAIRFGQPPPRVELGASPDPLNQEIRFWVRDNGPGIPAQDQEKIFVPFEQLGQVRLGGHGLGLSIVQRIVDKLGGRVGVESEPGRGSLFFFTLPAA